MTPSPLLQLLPWVEETIRKSIGSLTDRVEALIHMAPKDAVVAAEMLTGLASLIDDPDQRARALGVAASAFTVGKRQDRAEVHLDEAERLAASSTTKAEILARRAHYHHHQKDWRRLRDTVRAGLAYLEDDTSLAADCIRSRLHSQAAIPALYLDRDPLASARHSLAAMQHPATSDTTCKAALSNLAAALGLLDPKTAHDFLDRVYTWRQRDNASRADYFVAWIDGVVRAKIAGDKESRRAARRRLLWAAEGLFRVGPRAEAAMALVDLLTLGYQNRARGSAADLARRMLTAIQADQTFADEVKVAAAIYLETRAYARALQLRDAVIEHVHPGLFPRAAVALDRA